MIAVKGIERGERQLVRVIEKADERFLEMPTFAAREIERYVSSEPCVPFLDRAS
jgi:hypothetical protein